jgi:BirA family biotin operon repressor/biotin-[acetyl-CoA-carboxylase] ligase
MTATPPDPSSPDAPSDAHNGAPFDAEALRARLDPIWPGLRVETHAALGSTNDAALAWLRRGDAAGDLPAPLLVCAEAQTAGRGRQGRQWHSPPGRNLLFSLALPLPGDGIDPATGLAFGQPNAFNLAAAAIVCDRIERRSPLRPAIKWPNDVHVERRKLAGILSERASGGEGARGRINDQTAGQPGGRTGGIVVGIGLNVNAAPEDFPPDLRPVAVSLRQLTGAPWDRQALLTEIAGDLLKLAAGRDADAWTRAADAWRARCDTLGRWVTVARGNERIEGTALGLETDGALVIRTAEGALHRIDAGEVTLEKAE